MTQKFDIIIIGAGPGGYVAAIRAVQLGMKVAIIERESLGGVCLNWGCIPTKALLRSAEILRLTQHSSDFGVECRDIKINFPKMIERSRDVARKLSDGIKHLLTKNNVTVFSGSGALFGQKKVIVMSGSNKQELEAPHIIIATGARARHLAGMETDGQFIWNYKEAMVPHKQPKSLLVLGSGAIGVEFASFYNTIGTQVTIVELEERILRVEDEEIATLAHKAFEKQGIKILTGARTQSMTKKKDGIGVEILHQGKTIKEHYEAVIIAVGIMPNTENIGLEKTKIKLDKGHIQVNQYLATDEPGVYAIGDVVSGPWLAHKASHEAIICVEKIAGKNPKPINSKNIPGCTYCHPQIASVGYTEVQAKAAGFQIQVGKFPAIANGKAIAMGETEGMVKTIFDAKTGELLGAHMIGAEVTEMINGFIIAKNMEGTELDIMHSIFPHPTISEMMHESALAAYNRVIHI